MTLKAHWIQALTQVADAGHNGIRADSVDKRTATALERRDLIVSFEKTQYVGLNKPYGKSTWLRLTAAGLAWLVDHREQPTPSRAVPTGWKMIAAGKYVHIASRIEVIRDGRTWGALRPITLDPDTVWSVIDTKKTRAEAFAAAERAIPAALQLISDGNFETTGRPETWPAGQADETTVDARHAAVHASGARTGYQAKPDERVIHVELGTRGTYVHGDGDCSYVIFDGEGGSDLVHSGDVVVITEPRPARTMAVTREPKYADYTDLGGPDEPGEDYYLLVDGKQIGGTYWCSADDIPDGQRWASWGPAGYVLRNPDRDAAEAVQVREYVTNPDLFDRVNADYEREKREERERREAELEAEAQAYAEARRIQREGADGPGETIWALPPYHFLIAGHTDDVATVKAWLDAHDLDMVSGAHEIRVEQRATRQVIVVEQAKFFGLSAENTETLAVTLTTPIPDVDTTPRPDLVEMIIEQGHAPSKFPLIDFGQSYACSICTRENGSPTEMVCWPCPAFTRQREVGAAELAFAAAEREVIAAEAALRVAAIHDRVTTYDEHRVRDSEINYVRRRLTVSALTRDPAQHADIRFVMVSVSDDDGITWTPFHWLGVGAGPGETSSAMALRYADTRWMIENRPDESDLREMRTNPRPWRVEVFDDPVAEHPGGVWTNLTDPCRAGRHDSGAHPIATGPARPDGRRVQTACCTRCFHRVWRLAGGVWLPEGEPLPDSNPDSYSNPYSDPTSDAKINSDGVSSPSTSAVEFGFRVQTRTGRRWATVRVGNTPRIYRPDPTVLWATADSILGNVRQVLGLGTKDPLPGVRVRAWDRQTGLTHLVARRASHGRRKVNQRA